MRSVTVNVTDPRSWENAGMELLSYLSDLENRANRICERLATIGATRASIDFSRAFYQGPNDVSVTVEPTSGGYAIHARGNAVLFIELLDVRDNIHSLGLFFTYKTLERLFSQPLSRI